MFFFCGVFEKKIYNIKLTSLTFHIKIPVDLSYQIDTMFSLLIVTVFPFPTIIGQQVMVMCVMKKGYHSNTTTR